MIPPPPRSPLFPYTTLSRSPRAAGADDVVHPASVRERVAAVRAREVRADRRSLIGDHLAGRRVDRGVRGGHLDARAAVALDRKSTRLNSSHLVISYAVFCLK